LHGLEGAGIAVLSLVAVGIRSPAPLEVGAVDWREGALVRLGSVLLVVVGCRQRSPRKGAPVPRGRTGMVVLEGVGAPALAGTVRGLVAIGDCGRDGVTGRAGRGVARDGAPGGHAV
jgi:hypothetical protein